MSLLNSFRDDQIILWLCEQRLKLAEAVNDRQYISRLAGRLPEPVRDNPLYHILPSRRQWNAYRPRYRRSGQNPDLLALQNTVRALRRSDQPWVQLLNDFIARTWQRVFHSTFEFAPPEVRWQLKENHKYRAVSIFPLADNLILCLYAQYLRDEFDVQFSPSSYAFRAHRGGHTPTHHDAFTEIYNLKHNAPDQDFYVAECDIRGFYDTVDHGLALAAYRRAAHEAGLEARAEHLFQAYLRCYSFPQNVLAEAGPRLRQRDAQGYFPWPEEPLRKHHADPMTARVGVPQGGAISGVVANLILDGADKAVERKRDRLGAKIHYHRFCDDMIIISSVKRHCQAILDVYLRALDGLKLPYHEPQRTWCYGKQHWDHKSKAPYCWCGRKWFGCVPWVQFVGY
jgi:hypothetical protein